MAISFKLTTIVFFPSSMFILANLLSSLLH